MAYEKKTWQPNELVTAEKLNSIEDKLSRSLLTIEKEDNNTSITRENQHFMRATILETTTVPRAVYENNNGDNLLNTDSAKTITEDNPRRAGIMFTDKENAITAGIFNEITPTTSSLFLRACIPNDKSFDAYKYAGLGVIVDRSKPTGSNITYKITNPTSFLFALGQESTNTNVGGQVLRYKSNYTIQEMYNSTKKQVAVGNFSIQDSEGKTLGNCGVSVLTNSYTEENYPNDTYRQAFFRNSVYTSLLAHAYDDNGETSSRLELGCIARKDGTKDYLISNPALFRKALFKDGTKTIAEIRALNQDWYELSSIKSYDKADTEMASITFAVGPTSSTNNSNRTFLALTVYPFNSSHVRGTAGQFTLVGYPDGTTGLYMSSDIRSSLIDNVVNNINSTQIATLKNKLGIS